MPRILVVDDDAAIAEIVCINLEMAGYEVNQAPDGIQGQAMAIQIQPDLIVLDLMLPKVDGYTVCQRLRRDDRTSDIPILMLTALSQTQNKVEGFNAGADDYLTKPFEIEEMLARVRALLRRADRMKVYRLIGVELLERLPFFRFGKARIEKPGIADPGNAGELGPLDLIVQDRALGHVEQLDHAPIRSAVLD